MVESRTSDESNSCLVWINQLSIVSWHWPILSYLQIINGEFPHRDARISAVLVSILLAWLTYFFVEKPIRSSVVSVKRWVAKFCFLAFVGLAGLYVMLNDGIPNKNNIVDLHKVNQQFGTSNYTQNEMCLSKYGIEGSDKWSWFFCTLSKDSSPSIILLGNSYANHLYAGFVNNIDLQHHTVLSIGTCSAEWPNYEYRLEQHAENPNSPNPCWGRNLLVQFEHINKILKKEKKLKYAIMVLDDVFFDPKRFELLLRRIKYVKESGLEIILFQPHV